MQIDDGFVRGCENRAAGGKDEASVQVLRCMSGSRISNKHLKAKIVQNKGGFQLDMTRTDTRTQDTAM